MRFMLPNVMSMFRILAGPVMLWCAREERPTIFLIVFGLALVSDSIDGFLARRLHATSELGARLDSYGDFVIVLFLPLSVYMLWPEIILREGFFIAAALISYFVPTVVGLVKYRRTASYHTWGAKVSAVLMGISLMVMFLDWSSVPFRLCLPIVILEAMEEIWITALLPEWRADVPSVWHARRILAAERENDGSRG